MSNFFHRLLEQPEGKTLEFKKDLSSSKSRMKALVAFANTAGGRLIIGVSDDRQILGVEENPLSQEERLCSMIAELRRTVEGVAFDEMPMPELSIDDLDTKAIAQSVREKYPVGQTELQTLKLLVPYQGRLVPSKGAVILFGRERNRSFSDVWVQCGRFTDTDKADIFHHIEIYDHLPLAVESIMLFLKKHAMRGADFSAIRRKDVWSIPLGILREVVINALVHADYSQRGAPIRIAFFDDRIEIENPGILMPGMELQLKDRVNFSRMYLEPALALNLIEMTQPDSPKSPTQKYRLTKKGRQLSVSGKI